jgi:hypothetical protein
MPTASKYFVKSDDCTKDFGKYGKAVRWAKDRRAKETALLTTGAHPAQPEPL